MSQLALYRKWRPSDFKNIIGQNAIVQTLKNALLNNSVNHAYLFSGTRGTGKTSTAKVLAKAINCLNLKQGEPCNKCDNCIKFNKNIFFDLLEIDAASNRGIEEIRDLREKLKFHPVEGKTKVYIIDEVHMLTTEAFNALLKTLEDPPLNIVFILATTESQKIPLTILSRCQHFYFNRIKNDLIEKHLKKIILQTNSKITENALKLISKISEGSLRDAIGILDQCITFSQQNIINSEKVSNICGIATNQTSIFLIKAIGNKNLNEIIGLFHILKKEGKSISQLIKDLIEIFKNILLLKIGKNNFIIALQETIDAYKELSIYFEKEDLLDWIYILIDLENKVRFSLHPDILFEITLIKKVNNMIKNLEPRKKDIKKENKNNFDKKYFKNNEKENENLSRNGEELWNAFLIQLKKEKPLSYPFYREAVFGSFNNNIIIIFYDKKYSFHKERAEQEKNKIFAEKVLNKIFGKKIKLKLQYKEIKEINKNNDIEKNIKNIFGKNISFQ